MEADEELFLERMSWPEVEAALVGGKQRAVVCAGAIEQHGRHLPQGTDAWLGEALAGSVARELGDALVAPVVRPGCSDHHMGFPGTISVPADVLTALLDAYLVSLRAHGFTRFVVFPSHAGNGPVLAEWGRQQTEQVIVLTDLGRVLHAISDTLSAFGADPEGDGHAGLAETAALLALNPAVVRLKLAEAGSRGGLGLDELMTLGTRAITPSGVFGDPRAATQEMGEAVMRAWVGVLVEEVAEAERRGRRP
jgi:creatinine amidohydrolase